MGEPLTVTCPWALTESCPWAKAKIVALSQVATLPDTAVFTCRKPRTALDSTYRFRVPGAAGSMKKIIS